MLHSLLPWIAFNLFVLAMLALDLGVFQRKSHVIKMREALLWSAFWIALSLCFNIVIYFWLGRESALQFLAGYLVEKSLSVDNIFVIWMVFSVFCVPAKFQHRVLFWGILGAIVMRAIFIIAGITLINLFHGIIFIFGAFLIYTGIRMALHKDIEVEPGKNPVLKLANRCLPVSKHFQEGKFFTRENGKLMATPLFLVLLVVESTDLIFAVDSIPAVLAISKDPFIVYSSNVCAILGLRALYFAFAGLVQQFRFLHLGLSAILIFVGVKMLLSDIYHMPILFALGFIGIMLAGSIIASILFPIAPKSEPIDTADTPEILVSEITD